MAVQKFSSQEGAILKLQLNAQTSRRETTTVTKVGDAITQDIELAHLKY